MYYKPNLEKQQISSPAFFVAGNPMCNPRFFVVIAWILPQNASHFTDDLGCHAFRVFPKPVLPDSLW
jgi:hypothetical protein